MHDCTGFYTIRARAGLRSQESKITHVLVVKYQFRSNVAFPETETLDLRPCLLAALFKRGHRLLYALLKRLAGVDGRLWMSDRLEARFHFQIQREASVACWMVRVGFEVKTMARRLIGADALDNAARLPNFAGEFENAIDLITSRERAPVEKNFARGIFAQQEAGSFEHDLYHKVVLLSRVLDVSWREHGRPD